MKRFFYLFLAIIVLFLGLSFAYKNARTVQLNYYLGVHWVSPLSLMLLAALSLGVLLGFIASLGMVVRLQRQLSQARKEIRQIEQEVINLRSLPIKDVL
ncbi:MAG: LapA family protein [Acidiferrobacteraceae bacterium]